MNPDLPITPSHSTLRSTAQSSSSREVFPKPTIPPTSQYISAYLNSYAVRHGITTSVIASAQEPPRLVQEASPSRSSPSLQSTSLDNHSSLISTDFSNPVKTASLSGNMVVNTPSLSSDCTGDYDAPRELTMLERGLSACVGSVITSLFVTPMDLVKNRLQAQPIQPSLKSKSSLKSRTPTGHGLKSISSARLKMINAKAKQAKTLEYFKAKLKAKFRRSSPPTSDPYTHHTLHHNNIYHNAKCRVGRAFLGQNHTTSGGRLSTPQQVSSTSPPPPTSTSTPISTSNSTACSTPSSGPPSSLRMVHVPISGPISVTSPSPISPGPVVSSLSQKSTMCHPTAQPHVFFRPHSHFEDVLSKNNFFRFYNGVCDTWCDKCILRPLPGTTNAVASPPFTSAFDAFVRIARTEGPAALYKGLAPALAISIPSTAVYFSVYDTFRMYLEQRLKGHSEILPPLIAGICSRVLTTSAVSPLELARTMSQASPGKLTATTVLRNEFSTGGVRGLFRGLSATLWRDVPFSAVYWVGVEHFKRVFNNILVDSAAVLKAKGPAERQDAKSASEMRRFVSAFLAGAASGSIASTLTHPFDLVKTRRQISLYNLSGSSFGDAVGTGTFSLLKKTVQEEGWRGLFIGWAPRTMKIIPSCAIMLATYEVAKMLIWKNVTHPHDKNRKVPL